MRKIAACWTCGRTIWVWRLRERNFCSGKCRVRHHRSAFRKTGTRLHVKRAFPRAAERIVGKCTQPTLEFDSLLVMEGLDPKAGGYPEP